MEGLDRPIDVSLNFTRHGRILLESSATLPFSERFIFRPHSLVYLERLLVVIGRPLGMADKAGSTRHLEERSRLFGQKRIREPLRVSITYV